MKRTYFLLALLLAVCLVLPQAARADEASVYAHLGEELADFSVETIDGGVFTLSEALQDKDMVLVNLWATWCGPCEMEFPYMQEAYELYQDQVAVVALSIDPDDTSDVLAEYAQSHGMTFSVGSAVGTGLADTFATVGIPTTLIVDRFGTICFIQIGSMSSTGDFQRLFASFVGDDYSESEILEEMPPALPTAARVDGAELDAALGVEGAFNSEDPTVWPMIPGEKDGRSVLVSSNGGESESAAGVYWAATAAEGDALVFTFATSTETAMDMLRVLVDGEVVKSFGGEHDWTDWAIALESGEHTFGFEYQKDYYTDEGADCVWLDAVGLVSGEEAAAALAALPQYPVAEEFAIILNSPDAREIAFQGDLEGLYESFACTKYWIVTDNPVTATVLLSPGVDPEEAFRYSNNDDEIVPLPETLVDGAYTVQTGVDSLETTGYSYTNLYVYPRSEFLSIDELCGVMLFASEEDVDDFVEEMESAGFSLTWAYAEDAASETIEDSETVSADSEYTILFVDEDGAPVPGCVINFCTDEACVPVVADENGVASFSGAPYAYHLQVIKVPEGYAFDTAQEFTADPNGGELEFTIAKQ